MIQEHGGHFRFMREFLWCMKQEDSWWNHKCSNLPKHDVAHAFIIIENKIRYKVNVAGYESGPFTYWEGDKHLQADWKRIILCGPAIRAPFPIQMKGFQGIRYVRGDEPF